MTLVVSGAVASAYVEIADRDASTNRISRVVLRLANVGWFELTDAFTSDERGLCLPEPIGCNCTITDISERGWGNGKYEVEFASSYSRDGVFWSNGCREITKQQLLELVERDA
jgi:hypothetical protein